MTDSCVFSPLYLDGYLRHAKSKYMYFDLLVTFLPSCCIAFFCVFSLSIVKPSIPVNALRMYNQSLMATHTGIVVS